MDGRVPWYLSTAPAYASIFLWFVFWDPFPAGGERLSSLGGALSCGVWPALLGAGLAALATHYLLYLTPGILGLWTGLPLAAVASSTYGARGAALVPGLLLAILQLGWLGVSAHFSALLIYNSAAASPLGDDASYPVAAHAAIALLWVVLAALTGLKGIRYLGGVATFLPLIPLAILSYLLAKTLGGVGNFDPEALIARQRALGPALGEPLSMSGVLALSITYVLGYSSSACAAGADFGRRARHAGDVQLGGLLGIALAIALTLGAGILVVAGAHGNGTGVSPLAMRPIELLDPLAPGGKGTLILLLALSSFPGAAFAAFLSAENLRSAFPGRDPLFAVALGASLSFLLAASGLAGRVVPVFGLVGASFGPICGAITADYLISGRRWTGPRAGFNPSGWISWISGFAVGALPLLPAGLRVEVPAAPLWSYLVGALVYAACARSGLQSPRVAPPR